MIEELKKLDGQKIKCLQKRNPELVSWIMNKTSNMANISLAERIYIIINKDKILPCENGNKKRFESFSIGYRYCSMNCFCQIKDAALKRKQTNLKLYGVENTFQSEDKKQKIKQTSLRKYGTEHHLQNSEIREKQKQTNLKRYGVENPLQNIDIQTKQKHTVMKRYGVENIGLHVDTKRKVKQTNLEKFGTEYASQNTYIKEKTKQTSLRNFGTEYPLQSPIIREQMKQTNLKRHGVEYVFQSPIIKEQIKQTNMKIFGTEHPLQNHEIQEKMKQTNLERYGFENVSQNSEIQEKIKQANNIKYNRNSPIQKNISDDGYDVLLDEMKFRKILETKSLSEIANDFNLSYSAIQKYCQKYNIDLPSSSYETAICSFLKQHNINYKLHNRKFIAPLEIDIVLPDYKIGIEFCGLYYHCDLFKDKKYHLNKLRQMNAIGYRLITIFEDEWIFKRDIVERRLLNFVGLSEKGKGARKLSIQKTSWKEARAFLDTYHVQGAGVPGYVRYGAYDVNEFGFLELVAIMSFSKPRLALGKKKDSDIFDELLRFATNGKNYSGIASRLMKTFIKEFNPIQIISYADRRWSEGNLYKQLGFEMVKETDDVNYWHTKGTRRHYRFNFRKDKIKHLVENGELKTEVEIMRELGYSRIWDCGTLKFIWNKSAPL